MKILARIFLLVLCGLVQGCRSSTHQSDDSREPRVEGDKVILPPGSPQLAAVGTMPAEKYDGSTIPLNGRIVWDDGVTVRVFAPFAGRVAQIAADVGQSVKQNDTLALVASPDFGQAQADARRAEGDFHLAERTLDRARELFQHGAAPKKDLEAAEADFSRAQSERIRTAQRVILYGGSGDTINQVCPLKSPLEGVVVERNINPGQEVRPDQMLANAPQFFSPLFVITDPARLWVLLDVSEKDLPSIRPGKPVAVQTRAFPERVFRGRTEVISDFLDPTTRTVKVRASIDNSERLLKAEMFVTVELPADHPPGTDIAAKAVFLKGERHYVFVEAGPGEFVRREIRAGPEHDGKVPVFDGLLPGQRVVTEGSLLLEQLVQSRGGSGG